MKRLWVQLSLAFTLVIVFASALAFIIVFSLSWLIPDPVATLGHSQEHYIDAALPFIEQQIIAGKSDADIVEQMQSSSETELFEVIEQTRDYGYAQGVDATDRSFGRIFGDFVREFFSGDFVAVLFYAAIIGIGAGIITSRRFAKPLEELTTSVQKIGTERNSRVQVAGSQEIENLGVAFNDMADRLEQQKALRRTMLADVSHELRTPLTVLEGQLRGTLDGVFELNEERLAGYYQQTNYLIRLVEDLRLLAQAEANHLSLHLTRIDVQAVLEQTKDFFILEAESQGVQLESLVSGNPPFLYTDEQRLKQVLHNLLANALRYTPTGGKIQLYLSSNSTDVTISIKDSGDGVAQELLPHLFDRFYRVDSDRARESGGSGLGLAIVKSIITVMGGDVSAYSEGLGHGLKVTIRLPKHIDSLEFAESLT